MRDQRSGTLWEGRYRATLVDSEQYLLALMRYFELNPVRANMVAHPRDYRWSSYAFNAMGESGARGSWLTPHMEYTRLRHSQSERQSTYQWLFQAFMSGQNLNAIRDSTHKGRALGGKCFKKQVEALTNRQASSKGLGRLRNTE